VGVSPPIATRGSEVQQKAVILHHTSRYETPGSRYETPGRTVHKAETLAAEHHAAPAERQRRHAAPSSRCWKRAIARRAPPSPSRADPGLADDAGYSIAWGCCGHVFHLDCISRWLKTRSVCPLCNREWEFAKIEKIATYGNLD